MLWGNSVVIGRCLFACFIGSSYWFQLLRSLRLCFVRLFVGLVVCVCLFVSYDAVVVNLGLCSFLWYLLFISVICGLGCFIISVISGFCVYWLFVSVISV